MKFFERAAAPMAALGSINVSPAFQIGSQDAKLEGQSQRAGPNAATTAAVPALFNLLQGNFSGVGINTIFRPNSQGAGGTHPGGLNSTDLLEINLTSETLSFSPSIGSVPNRGLDPQGDIFITAVPYTQAINDVTNIQSGKADAPITAGSGIHFEPGLFLNVPATSQNPVVGTTINRIASIPHGTTINAQALEPATPFAGGPQFFPVDITPFVIGNPGNKIRFAAQTANNSNTPRLPQDLTKFIQTGAVTQAILDNPNVVLQQAAAGQKFANTFVFTVSTVPSGAVTGGGVTNDDFLTGGSSGPNALAFQMNATFWIETVNWTVTVPPSKSGQTQTLLPVKPNNNVTLPQFSVTPTHDITKATNITAQSTQIQYTQLVILNFNGLSWPHASVNTLTQQGLITVPASAFN